MRMNYTDIKAELKDNWEQFADNQYPEDLLNEFADSACPVYYSEIVKEWQEMPNEYTDVWCEEGHTGNTIYSLMTYDLYNYYHHQYHRAYSELCEEMEPQDA